jgi:O-antigen/teichoic acid export membrane protein
MRAAAWSAAGYGSTTLLRFISRITLASLLGVSSPMGDVAIVVTILTGLELLSDLGIGIAIVQHKRGTEPAFLGTALSVQALRGVVLWLLGSALAWPVASIYSDPELFGLLLLGALSPLLRGFANPATWILNRRLDLRLPVVLTIVSEVGGFAVTIVWAFLAPSAWAIVAGAVASALFYAAASHFAVARTRFAWDRRLAREMASFGGWMILSSATHFMASRGETFLLRGAIPEEQFGTFAFAVMLVATPVAAITQLSTQVFFPSLSSAVRAGSEQGERNYRKAKWLFTWLGLAIAWGGALLGPPIVAVMNLGETFQGLGAMVQILGLRAGLEIYGTTTGTALFAMGAARYSSFANTVRLVTIVGGLLLVLPLWGLAGAFVILIGAPLVAYGALMPGLVRHFPQALALEAVALPTFVLGTAAAAATGWLVWGPPQF